jgi:hypothetical protein
MQHSLLDPSKANVGFSWAPIGDYPDGEYNVGRMYYWYDPAGIEQAISDHDFRPQHSEIEDREWRQLFNAAFDRGERQFLQSLKTERPELFESKDGMRTAFLGYIFGPCRPSGETLDALGIERGD